VRRALSEGSVVVGVYGLDVRGKVRSSVDYRIPSCEIRHLVLYAVCISHREGWLCTQDTPCSYMFTVGI
jgi:hypothetical protein